MRFDLSDQQRDFQASVSEMLADACPKARALAAHDSEVADLEVWRQLMALGIGAICVPEEHGGLGLNILDLAIVAEAIGRAAAPGPFIEHSLATLAIALGGNERQKSDWLPKLAEGAARATIAFAEPGGHWAPQHWTRSVNGVYSGKKEFVLHADGSDLIVIGLADGDLAIVDGADPNLQCEPIRSTDGGKCLSHIEFKNVAADLFEKPVGERIFDAGLVLLAADAFGGASRSVEMAVEYAKEREQFGRVIGSFQAVKHQLADMTVAIEPAIGLYWYAAHAFDAESKEASSAAALAKAHITEIYPKITRAMIEAHGGIGYTWEFGAHVWLKRALFDQAYLGTPHMHRMRVADMSDW
jgi:alkylation response protein AidB-like acyl-CoA dehydrogenase